MSQHPREPTKSQSTAKANRDLGSESRLALRTLAPKGPETFNRPRSARGQPNAQGHSQITPASPLRRCEVCFRVDCKLVSHIFFGGLHRKAHVESNLKDGAQALPKEASFSSSYAYQLAQKYVDRDIAASKVDPFYDLPIPQQLNTTEMHRLFHTWFTIEADQCFTIPRPPEMAADLLFSPFLAPALSDPALCLSILAMATAAASRSGSLADPHNDVEALTIMGLTMEKMRERISDSPNPVSDTTIAAATFLWSINWYMLDQESLKQHKNTVTTLVKSRGGLKKLGLSGALARYVAWTDILNSMLVGEESAFSASFAVPVLKDCPARQYGRFWDMTTSLEATNLDTDVVEGCKQLARLIEVLEEVEQGVVTAASSWYIFMKLSATFQDNSIFQARHRQAGNLNECVCLAVYLIQFRVFLIHSGQKLKNLIMLGELLVQAIKNTGKPSTWQAHLDLLIWLLFLLLVIGDDFHHRDWCLRTLIQINNSKYGSENWPSGWQDEFRSCVSHFIWCESRFSKSFNKACALIWQLQIEDTSESSGSR